MQAKLSTSTTGALAELQASVWLLSKGYMVFRNVSPDGLIDIVAKKDEETLFIDVTKAVYRKRQDGKDILQRNNQKEKIADQYGIQVLYVNSESCVFHKYEPRPMHLCKRCSSEFVQFGSRTVFCSAKCKTTHYDDARKMKTKKWGSLEQQQRV
jgi:Holliday junction resolvase-like predicted endonuclease